MIVCSTSIGSSSIRPITAGNSWTGGHSYSPAIYVHNDEQRREAEQSKEKLRASKRFKAPIVTEILPAAPFYPAETEHQHYYRTHPLDYKLYQKGSGRDDFTALHWNSRKDQQRLREQLTELQYEVTQNKGMEPPYQNAYWDHYEAGIYTDIISGDPLFSSADKFDSGTGWPGFTRPVEEGLVRREADYGGGQVRTVLRSRLSGAYLGYVSYDGPETGKPYYVINSAALRFISKDQLAGSGLERYLERLDREAGLLLRLRGTVNLFNRALEDGGMHGAEALYLFYRDPFFCHQRVFHGGDFRNRHITYRLFKTRLDLLHTSACMKLLDDLSQHCLTACLFRHINLAVINQLAHVLLSLYSIISKPRRSKASRTDSSSIRFSFMPLDNVMNRPAV